MILTVKTGSKAMAMFVVLLLITLSTVSLTLMIKASRSSVKQAGLFKTTNQGSTLAQSEARKIIDRLKPQVESSIDFEINYDDFVDEYITNANSVSEASRAFFVEFAGSVFENRLGLDKSTFDRWPEQEDSLESGWFSLKDIPNFTGLVADKDSLEVQLKIQTKSIRVAQDFQSVAFDYYYEIVLRLLDHESEITRSLYDSGNLSFHVSPIQFTTYTWFRQNLEDSYTGAQLHYYGQRYQPEHPLFKVRRVYDGPTYLGSFANGVGVPMAGDVKFVGTLEILQNNEEFGYVDKSAIYPGFSSEDTGGVGHPIFESGIKIRESAIPLPQHANYLQYSALGSSDIKNIGLDSEPTNANVTSLVKDSVLKVIDSESGTLEDGIFIPGEKKATGGIFVLGDVSIRLDKLNFDQLSLQDQNLVSSVQAPPLDCEFQQIKLSSYTGEEYKVLMPQESSSAGCFERSLVLKGDNIKNLDNYLNGAIYVRQWDTPGRVLGLGPEDEDRPAIAKDFQVTIGADSEILIDGHLRYEDAQFAKLDEYGSPLGDGDISDMSGYELDEDPDAFKKKAIRPVIHKDSKTLLSIVSTGGHILINNYGEGRQAPENIHLHANLLAIGSECSSSGNGSDLGCGVGVRNFFDENGVSLEHRGVAKILGSVAEYRGHATEYFGAGYRLQAYYDKRLNKLAPQFFPRSEMARIKTYMMPSQTLTISAN